MATGSGTGIRRRADCFTAAGGSRLSSPVRVLGAAGRVNQFESFGVNQFESVRVNQLESGVANQFESRVVAYMGGVLRTA
ncbi:hypothetical protein GCM10029964_005910 [Kibdelosporangium lantanae]